MHSKLAGHLPLQEMIAQTLESARVKIAAAEDKESGKVKKLVEYEKKEHGGKIPSVKEEEDEKKKMSSVLDPSDPDEMNKLASALDEMGEELLKEADSVENGGEAKQGGEQLATQSPTGGKQVYTGAKATAKHQVTAGGMQATKDNPGAATANATDDKRAPGGTGAKYPAKGVLKTAGEDIKAMFAKKKDDKGEKKEGDKDEEKKEKKSGVAALQAVVDELATEKQAFALTDEGHKLDAKRYGAISKANHDAAKAEDDYAKEAPVKASIVRPGQGAIHRMVARHNDYAAKKHEEGKNAYNPFGGLGGKSRHEEKEKKSEAVGFILDKLAEFHGGGETLDDKPAPVPSNEGRQLIANNKAPVSATKREAKGPGRKQLSEVLSEPAQTKSTDSTVQDNLRNAAKGGVKIAAVKAYLGKIAEAGCVCAGAGECDYCRMKSSVEKKRADKKVKQSLGAPPMGPAPMAGGPMGGSPTGGM